jgi:perosamine synthetase
MDRLLEIGDRFGIPVIEDAAEAIGSIYHGKRAGSMGVFGVFSFHGTKTITTGEGGIFVTNNTELYERVSTLSNHGRARGQVKQFWPDMVGFKYKMSNIQAAIGCGQLERIEELVIRKQKILEIYRKELSVIPGVSLNSECKGTVNGAWMPTIVFSEEVGVNHEFLKNTFERENIDARVFFWPLSSLPMFQATQAGENNINAYSISRRAINLPSYHDLSSLDQQRVVDTLYSISRKLGLVK